MAPPRVSSLRRSAERRRESLASSLLLMGRPLLRVALLLLHAWARPPASHLFAQPPASRREHTYEARRCARGGGHSALRVHAGRRAGWWVDARSRDCAHLLTAANEAGVQMQALMLTASLLQAATALR
jgi:hypothetical protein